MSDVRSICAIGQRGQLGLKGRMPWEGRTDRAFVEDVERFFELTRGHVLIAGPTTANSVPDWARAERTVVIIRSSEPPQTVLATPTVSSLSAAARRYGTPTPPISAIGTSPACPMTATPTAGSIPPGWSAKTGTSRLRLCCLAQAHRFSWLMIKSASACSGKTGEGYVPYWESGKPQPYEG
jgi:hypothetical protein